MKKCRKNAGPLLASIVSLDIWWIGTFGMGWEGGGERGSPFLVIEEEENALKLWEVCWQAKFWKLLSIFWSLLGSLLFLFWDEENVLPALLIFCNHIHLILKAYFSDKINCISQILLQNVLTTVLAVCWPAEPDLPALRHLHPSSFHTASGQHQHSLSYYHTSRISVCFTIWLFVDLAQMIAQDPSVGQLW